MARVVVTGANGALGSAVVRKALDAGLEVVAFVLEGTSLEALDGLEVELKSGDVLRPSTLANALDGSELCIHTAGDTSFYRNDRRRLEKVNVEGVRNTLFAAEAAGIRRFVHTSSVGAVGYDTSGREADESQSWNWPDGLGYMETKRDGERLALAAAQPGFEVVALNPATILGPGKLNPGDEELVDSIRTGRLPFNSPGGTTLCDVEDVAATHVAALERGRSGERYILGGPSVTYGELFAALAHALGVKPPRVTLPSWTTRTAAALLAPLEERGVRPPVPAAAVLFSSMKLYYSSKKAVAELDYRLRSLEEIAGRTCSGKRK